MLLGVGPGGGNLQSCRWVPFSPDEVRTLSWDKLWCE